MYNAEMMNRYMKDHAIPFPVVNKNNFEHMKKQFVLFYQAVCPVRIAVFEGGHRETLGCYAIKKMYPMGSVPHVISKIVNPFAPDSCLYNASTMGFYDVDLEDLEKQEMFE